ncbi:hypothetical protein pb186bvf_008029 [Paramecium bursaria]
MKAQSQYEQVPQYYGEKIDISLVNPRVNFIRKVLTIVFIQLSVTTLASYLAFSSTVFYQLTETLSIPAFITLLVSLLWLSFSRQASRQFPKNIILLSIFTISESLIVANIVQEYNYQDVKLAFYITVVITFALSAYAWSSKTEISSFFGIVLTLSSALLFSSLYRWISGYRGESFFQQVAVGLVMGIYIIIDIKLICDPKNENLLSIDDYVHGSLMLYTDIVRLFLKILKTIAKEKKDD